MAKQKVTGHNLTATFLVMDALALKDWSERFDNVIDSGLFHVFSDDDRRRYVEGLATCEPWIDPTRATMIRVENAAVASTLSSFGSYGTGRRAGSHSGMNTRSNLSNIQQQRANDD